MWKNFCILLVVPILLLGSCKNDNQSLHVGSDLINLNNSNVVSVDSFTLSTYTVRFDSLVTSGGSVGFVGQYAPDNQNTYHDGFAGIDTVSSYFDVDIPAQTNSFQNRPTTVFDSVCLVLRHTRQYYGDTTQPVTLVLKQLDTLLSIHRNMNNYRYNNSSILGKGDDTVPTIGRLTYIPRPILYADEKKEIHIRLNYEFGDNLFKLVEKSDPVILNSSDFAKFIGGFELTSENSSAAVYGYAQADSSFMIRLYYRLLNSSGITNKVVDFRFKSDGLQFNRFRSFSPKLDSLKRLRYKLSSKLTGNMSLVQSGTGFMTRIEMPGLKSIINSGKGIKVIDAHLYLIPESHSYRYYPLPNLSLYQTDPTNILLGNAIIVKPTYNYTNDNMQAYYDFDLTAVIQNLTNVPYQGYVPTSVSDKQVPAVVISGGLTVLGTGDLMSDDFSRVIIVNDPSLRGYATMMTSVLKVTYWQF